ncbi:MAG: sodium-dependent bicarbonate transport family permease, partial [Bdellovibrionia bacterium]
AGKFLSIYLLLAIGLKGGYQVQTADSLNGFASTLLLGLISCIIIPLIIFHFFKKQLGVINSSALGACLGSVSAVTFVTAQGALGNSSLESSGFMVAVMALMEIPAVIIALYLFQRDNQNTVSVWQPLKGALTNKSVILLVSGFLVGMVLNEKTWVDFEPFTLGIFKGMLGLFLLDLGVGAQEKFSDAIKFKMTSLLTGIILPLAFGTLFAFLGSAAGLRDGDAFLLAVLTGSASYIAAPAAIRAVAPTANTALYVGIPLGITFPFNILIGIPYYLQLTEYLYQ